MNDILFKDVILKDEIESRVADWSKKKMVVTTPGGIKIHISVMDDGERRILDQNAKAIRDGIGEKVGWECASCCDSCNSQRDEEKRRLHPGF